MSRLNTLWRNLWRQGECVRCACPNSRVIANNDIKPPFNGDIAIEHLLNEYEFKTVLDIGCGNGIHSKIFSEHGKDVTPLDFHKPDDFLLNSNVVEADFLSYDFNQRRFDVVWCSHVLEHQPNPNIFLKKIHSILEENGILVITVPPLKHQVVSGHVALWNAGILLYHLVIAGFDCTNARIKKYKYNISVIIREKKIEQMLKLTYGLGDMRIIKNYLPREIKYTKWGEDIAFYGDIEELNWCSHSTK